jgi:hypothetical protein
MRPQSPLNEGGADFGVDLAFPGAERLAFEPNVLYPLAGLDPATAPAFDALRRRRRNSTARCSPSRRCISTAPSRVSSAIELAERYQASVGREAAEQSLDFESEYRSYVINYSVWRSAGAGLCRSGGG